ncbi:unnamed protein product, partial [Brenthis ino]
MSLKNGKPEKKKPRAMPVEAIVTRYKSKQKQLEKDQQSTTSSIVDVKNQKSCKKIVQKAKKVQKKHVVKTVEEDEKRELYPNKVKRKIGNKKIVLLPKNHFKLIGAIKGCNKRKLCRPRKEIPYQKRQRHNSNSSNESKIKQKDISIIDMVKVMEDSKSLDDEDLLEILTCPSPVWWEDPPDGYIEEAIFSRPQPKFVQKSVKSQILEEQKKEEERTKIVSKVDLSNQKIDSEMKMPSITINVENRDKTFINKRSKLETLLGNIKNKASNTKVSDTKDNLIKKTKHFKKIQNLKNKTGKFLNKRTKSINKSQNGKNKIDSNVLRNNLEISQSDGSKDGNEKDNKNDTEIKVKSENKKRNSDSFNLSDFEDDVLNNLENIDIPIEKLDDDKNFTLNMKKEEKDENLRRNSIESNLSEKNMTAEYLDMSVFDDDIMETKMEDSPISIVKIEKNTAECENFESVNNKKEKKNNSNSKSFESEHVTVYKIINNELNNEVNKLKIILAKDDTKIAQNIDKSKENNGKINNYYKQCKKIKLNNKNVSELTKTDVTPMEVQEKSILISESDAVRYCFICSSIFDKESCDYCEKKGLKRKKMVFSCDVCGLKVNTKQEMIKHLEEHIHNIIQ